MTDKVQKIREEVARIQLYTQSEVLKQVLDYIDSLQEDISPLTKVNSTLSQTEVERGVCSQQEEFSIVIVLNGQRHRQVLHKGCFSKKECKEKCSLYERCQRCCIDLCMIFFHDPHCHFEEEPVSEDLEKVSKKYSSCIYLEEVLSDDDKEVLRGRLINTFKAGAKWKEEQFEKNRIEHCEDITEEQYKLETGFVDLYIERFNRLPTILDAIEYGKTLGEMLMIGEAVEITFNVSLPCGVYDKLKAKGCEDGDKLLIIKKED